MSETPGTLIGRSNILTPGGDAPPAELGVEDLAELRTLAVRALEGREAFIHDAIFDGRRVRLYSNSHHLADFWRDNWMTEAEWSSLTGRPVARAPELTLYAMTGVKDFGPSWLIAGTQAILFNTARYDHLRELCLNALVVAGVDVKRGSVVGSGGRVRVIPGEAGPERARAFWEAMAPVDARFVAEHAFIAGEGRVHPVERRICVSPAFLADHPEHASALLQAKFENVPGPDAAEPDRGRVALRKSLERDPSGAIGQLPVDRAEMFLARVLASPDARVLLDPAALFGRGAVATGPLEVPDLERALSA